MNDADFALLEVRVRAWLETQAGKGHINAFYTSRFCACWIPIADCLPPAGIPVALVDATRHRSFEAHGCVKDVGVLVTDFGEPHWSTQGSTRALVLKAFTHWLALPQDPEPSSGTMTGRFPPGPNQSNTPKGDGA
jgi:hypothetical protein